MPSSSPTADSRHLPRSPACPFCEGDRTELMNAFGSHASVSTYWCRDCRCPFEVLKWTARPSEQMKGDGGTEPGGEQR